MKLGGMAGIAAAIVVAAAAALYVTPDRPDQAAFDKAAWDKAEGCARASMVEDLTATRLLQGTNKTEVADLLGTGLSRIRGNLNCLEYELGRCGRVPGAEGEALVVCFNGNDRLAKVWSEPH